jgi:1,4-dihydroxy-2-naphthoate octaprenyltransferase
MSVDMVPLKVESRPSAAKVWLAAIRPATLTAAVGPVAVGTGLAVADHQFHAGPAMAALVGAMLIQVATNLHNDYEDSARGADTDQRLGAPRATQRGWLSAGQVLTGALVAAALALAIGCYLVWVGGWPIVAVGLSALLCGFAYTGGPAPLGYLGLGDLFVFLFFGVVAVAGTYYVQALTVTPSVFWASVGVGTLATAILVVNNLRDRHTDQAAAKRTLAVRFGQRFGRAEYTLLVAVAYLLPFLMWLFDFAGAGWLLCGLSLPLAWIQIRRVLSTDGAALNPLLGSTARLGLIYSLLLAVGVTL